MMPGVQWVRWMMNLFGHRWPREEGPPAPPRKAMSSQEIREKMTREDPDFERVRRLQHDALQVLTAKGIKDGMALRRERKLWEQTRHHL